MRHTHSGLAIPDFPTMGGEWLPQINTKVMSWINSWRFDNGFDSVTRVQVLTHLTHRLGAGLIVITVCVLNMIGIKCYKDNKLILKTLFTVDALIFLQINLGILTILTLKGPVITSLHVVNGALILGVSFLLLLRVAPLQWSTFRKIW